MSLRNHVIGAASIIALLGMALPAFAQTLGEQPAPVQYTVAPETPGPNAPVYIEVRGVGNFLGNSQVVWKKDGKVVSSGTGLRTFSFTTGALGTKTVIELEITSSVYGIISHTFTFSPSFVNLVWEANTTVPPFYAGKALASPGATVRVVAFPNILDGKTKISPQNLSFQWQLNDKNVPDQSGLGRSTFVLAMNQLHTGEDVRVDVYSGNDKVGEGDLTIPATQPELVLYANDPLRGILYRQALGSSFAMPGSELTVRAEPYFFSIESGTKGQLQYVWRLNGEDIGGPNASAGEITLRQTQAGQGNASFFVSLQNNDSSKLLQAATVQGEVSFGGQTTSLLNSLFGI